MIARARTLPLVLLVASLAACASDTLSERDARSVKIGQVLPTSYTAAVRGTQVHVMVPSGRVDLTLSKPVDEIPAQDALDAHPLRPAKGSVAVGVAWSLNRGGYADVTNRQLTAPSTVFGTPQPVRLWLVTDGTRREIPNVDSLETPRARPRNAAWLVVPTGVRQWRFDVEYDGVTQSVDARSGTVTQGRAAGLYRPLPLDRSGSCDLGRPDDGEYYGSCLLKYAVGYPYVDGAGWAPSGKTLAVVKISVGSELDGQVDVRVAGAAPVTKVSDSSDQFLVFALSPARSYAIRGTGTVSDEGKTRTLPVTGTIDNGGVL